MARRRDIAIEGALESRSLAESIREAPLRGRAVEDAGSRAEHCIACNAPGQSQTRLDVRPIGVIGAAPPARWNVCLAAHDCRRRIWIRILRFSGVVGRLLTPPIGKNLVAQWVFDVEV